MSAFAAHHLTFEARVETPLFLGEHPGSAIRGALFHALRGRPERPGFCVFPANVHCRDCAALDGCAVSFLLATVDEEGRRGGDVPRPYTVEPPLGGWARRDPGQPFTFGLTLFARAMTLFPYVVVAARRMEEEGIGRKTPDARGIWRPGRFRIERTVSANPLSGEAQLVHQRGDELVSVPAVPVTHDHVLARAKALAEATGHPTRLEPLAEPMQLTIDFLTPTRLIEDGRPLHAPAFRPLVQRLIERLSSLWERYGGEQLPIDYPSIIAAAAAVRLVADETEWISLRGFSTRQDAPKRLDGFVGRATYEGELRSLLPWLLWGEHTHVGKDAVKGCGLYRIVTL